MSIKSDSRLAEFLRRVRAGGDGVAPAEAIFGDGATADVQVSMAREFASSVHEMGYIEPAGGDGDLGWVRVTSQGAQWLDEYDGRAPILHPRYSS